MQTYIIVSIVATLIIVAIILFILSRKKSQDNEVLVSVSGSPKRGFSLASIFKKELNDSFYESLKTRLLEADSGVRFANESVNKLKDKVHESKAKTTEEAKALLREILISSLISESPKIEGKTLIFVIGVNGVGKTTSIAKIASLYKNEKTILLGAADTFRAAAIEQLEEWGQRLGVSVVKGQQGGDAASVLFDALSKARAKNIDIVIADTAGRFHNKEHLVRELSKMKKIAVEKFSDFNFLPVLVLDATVGQNGFEQAKVFLENIGVKGVMLSKFDATAKGGVVFALSSYLNLPVYFVGLGEKPENIARFNAEDFIDTILNG